ncbi:MAG: 50S ribosomal protein L15 [Gammaproteobacteria bacterium]
MRLNTMAPASGAKRARKRVGRGIACGQGKTCGRGHKGQRSRAGGKVKAGYEGGQMPLKRRLPKFGFRSMKARDTSEVRLHELAKVPADTIDLQALKAAKIIGHRVKRVKVIASGTLESPVTVKGLRVTKGAREAIEAIGGNIED